MTRQGRVVYHSPIRIVAIRSPIRRRRRHATDPGHRDVRPAGQRSFADAGAARPPPDRLGRLGPGRPSRLRPASPTEADHHLRPVVAAAVLQGAAACRCRRSARSIGRSTRSGPTSIHIATEATLGLERPPVTRSPRRFRSSRASTPTSTSTATITGSAGPQGVIWRYLRWFHNRTRETYVPSRATIADLEARGFERLVLWPRGVDGRLFRPDRPGRGDGPRGARVRARRRRDRLRQPDRGREERRATWPRP